jgi:prepilin-type N-terminal cleavage/methylation domain-containing protein
MNTHMRKRGFTLIELLVVIAIIGILASIVLASLNTARSKGRDAKRVADAKSLQSALELYYDSNNSYPLALSSLTSGNYISVIPSDPGAYTYNYYPASAADETAVCSAEPCSSYIIRVQTENAPPTGAYTWASGNVAGQAATICTTGSSAPFNYCAHN